MAVCKENNVSRTLENVHKRQSVVVLAFGLPCHRVFAAVAEVDDIRARTLPFGRRIGVHRRVAADSAD